MPAIAHRNQIIGQATDAEALVRDTVGWTGKNLLKNTSVSQTKNGVTFTVNSDGTVIANGTASADAYLTINAGTLPVGNYIKTGCPAGGSSGQTYWFGGLNTGDDVGNGRSISVTDPTAQYSFIIAIKSGYIANNLVFKPMLRKASIVDPTYEPYHRTVEAELEDAVKVNSAEEQFMRDTVGWSGKNKLNASFSGQQTTTGVTVVKNADGSYTLNGTSTNDGNVVLRNALPLSNGKYILTAEFSGTSSPINSSHKCYIGIRHKDDSLWTEVNNYDGVKSREIIIDSAVVNNSTCNVKLMWSNGVTFTNYIVKPMLRPASIQDDTYEPYHESVEAKYEEELYGVNLLKPAPYLGGAPITSSNFPMTYYGLTLEKTSDGEGLRVHGTYDNTNSLWLYLICADAHGYSDPNLISGEDYIASIHYNTNPSNLTESKGDLCCIMTGTISQSYYLSATPQYEGNIAYYKFTMDSHPFFGVRLGIRKNKFTTNAVDFTIYGMIRKAEIDDPTYRPYNRQSLQHQIDSEYTLLKDTAGRVRKNLIPLPYCNKRENLNVIPVVNDDGSLSLNGSQGSTNVGQYYLSSRFEYDFQLPAGKYILTGGTADAQLDIGVNNVTGDSSQGSTTLGQDKGNGLVVTLTKLSDVQIILMLQKNSTFSNVTIYPMLRKVEYIDDSYEKYSPNVSDELSVMQNQLSSKNILHNTAKSTTSNGITYTVNSDGTIVLNGTATSNAGITILPYTEKSLPEGKYILSDEAGYRYSGSDGAYTYIRRKKGSSGTDNYAIDTAQGPRLFTVDYSEYDYIGVSIYILSGTVCDNLVLKPMIRPASIADDTYVPYSMTNRELTDMMPHISKDLLGLPTALRCVNNGTSVSVRIPRNSYMSPVSPSLGNTASNSYLIIAFNFGGSVPQRYKIAFAGGQDSMANMGPTLLESADNGINLSITVDNSGDVPVHVITLSSTVKAWYTLAVYKMPVSYIGYDAT